MLDVGINLLRGGRVFEGYPALLVRVRRRQRVFDLQYNSWSSCRACAIFFRLSLKERIRSSGYKLFLDGNHARTQRLGVLLSYNQEEVRKQMTSSSHGKPTLLWLQACNKSRIPFAL